MKLAANFVSPGEDPVGKVVMIGESVRMHVIGVVADVHETNVEGRGGLADVSAGDA